MEYIEIKILLSDRPDENLKELLPYWLESIGYDGFYETDDSIIAYIPASSYNREKLTNLLSKERISENCIEENLVPEKNWNEDWEKNFEPVVIDNKCIIRATFHKPEKKYPIEIIIEPKMSFGTGHHATTSLMVSELLRLELKDRHVFDAGCGTGILAILAEKLGAPSITAIDFDEWSYRNAVENIALNHCQHINVFMGDVSLVDSSQFDIILANINLNVLISGMSAFSRSLKKNGLIIMSGIFETDLTKLRNEAEKSNLEFLNSRILNKWALASFINNL